MLNYASAELEAAHDTLDWAADISSKLSRGTEAEK